MKLTQRVAIGAMSVVVVGGSFLGVTLSSSAGAVTHASPPDLSKPTSMMLLGSNGKPILGKSGKPIMLQVGGPPPTLPAPGSAAFNKVMAEQKPMTQAEIDSANARGPATIKIPSMSDKAKAQLLAPGQAAP